MLKLSSVFFKLNKKVFFDDLHVAVKYRPFKIKHYVTRSHQWKLKVQIIIGVMGYVRSQ